MPRLFSLALLLTLLGGIASPARADDAADIRAMLEAQVAGWNSGDVARYMDYYVKSDRLRFASGGSITYGWKETLERYRKSYPDQATMGTLTCTYLDIDVVAPDTAIVFGRWELRRSADQPWGLFTLLVKKTAEGWRVAADHTSSSGK